MTATELLSTHSIAQLRRALAQKFAAAALESPQLDARLIIGSALNLDHTAIIAQADRGLSRRERELVVAAAARRLSGEPIARIKGVKEFWGLPFGITKDVLVPRPQSETLIATALDLITRARAREHPLKIADLGTGSGALLLALLHELPAATGIATDLCPRALALARNNARCLGLAARAGFLLCDFGGALADGSFDLILSNPPYIASSAISGLPREVRDHDPRLALDGGPDGLEGYRRLAVDAARVLRGGGHLILELGAGGWPAAAAPFVAAGLVVGSPRQDLAGVPRALPVLRSCQT
jgi:release factor glutamine methyltransferase